MSKVTIIAEVGVNFLGDMRLACTLINRARQCGCDIAKFQLYSVDALFPDKKVMAQGKNWYDEIKTTELTKDQALTLSQACWNADIEPMFSVFDLERLEWVVDMGLERIKIGSRANQDADLIGACLATGKELLISGADAMELSKAIVRGFQGEEIDDDVNPPMLLYCIPEYPASPESFGFGEDPMMFQFWDGLSDHSVGGTASIIAVARGAAYIEKHFCLHRDASLGPDFICSMEPEEMTNLVQMIRRFEKYGL